MADITELHPTPEVANPGDEFSDREKDLLLENYAMKQRLLDLQKQLLSYEDRMLKNDLQGKYSWLVDHQNKKMQSAGMQQ